MTTPTNRDLADKLNLHYSFIHRLRTGKRLPSRETMFRLAEAYDLTDRQLSEWNLAMQREGREGSRKWLEQELGW